MGCSRHTSWQIGSAESSTVRTTNIYPFPKMLPDRALGWCLLQERSCVPGEGVARLGRVTVFEARSLDATVTTRYRARVVSGQAPRYRVLRGWSGNQESYRGCCVAEKR